MSDYVTLHRTTHLMPAGAPEHLVEVIAESLKRLEEDAWILKVTPDWGTTRIDLDFSEIDVRTMSQAYGDKIVGTTILEVTVRAKKEEH